MIRKPSRDESLGSPDASGDEDLFWKARGCYDPRTDICPACGHAGLRLTSSYRRRMLTVAGGERAERHVWVPCVRCEGCGGYHHALLFDVLIPFTSYTLLFIMTVLDAYFNRTSKVLDVCADWGIRPNTLYSWKKRFISHYNSWCSDSLRKIPAHESLPDSTAPGSSHWKMHRLLSGKTREALRHAGSIPAFASAFFDAITRFSFLQPNERTHRRRLPIDNAPINCNHSTGDNKPPGRRGMIPL